MNVNSWIDKLCVSPFNYWACFVVDISFIIIMVLVGFLYYGGPWYYFVPLFVGGALFFSILEYGIHRWVFHIPGSPFYKGHMAHHADPGTKMTIPFFLAPLILSTSWLLVWLICNGIIASFFIGGVALGYVAYGVVHHLQHQLAHRSGPLVKSWAYHNIHHKMPTTNFGVTTRFWDRVFRTHYLQKK